MILLPHMLAGAALGSRIHNFAILFVAALVLHFFFDRLPHWEYAEVELDKMGPKEISFFLFKSIFDFSFGIFLLWLFWPKLGSPIYVIFAVFVSLLPDGICFLYLVIKILFKSEVKILKKFYNFHHLIHGPKHKKSLFWELAIEGLTVIILLLFIMY